MAIVVSEEVRGEDQKLTILENERRVLSDKLARQRQDIRNMAHEYGKDALSGRHEMMLQRVAALQGRLTEFEMRRIALELKVEQLKGTSEQALDPEKLLKFRQDFINADLMVQALISNIAQLDQCFIGVIEIINPHIIIKS